MPRKRKNQVRSMDDLVRRCVRPDPWPTSVNITLEVVDLVGESNYIANIRAMTDGDTERQVVGCLILEPNNPYDPRAIAVHGHIGRESHITLRALAGEEAADIAADVGVSADVALRHYITPVSIHTGAAHL